MDGDEPDASVPHQLEGDGLTADGGTVRAGHQDPHLDGRARVGVVGRVEREDHLVARALRGDAADERESQQAAGEKTNGPMAAHARGSFEL